MLEDKNKSGVIVNDAQSKLNSTWMKRLLVPKDIKEIKDALVEAENEGLMISIA